MSPFERTCEQTLASKAMWEASRQIRAAAQMIEIASRDADANMKWRIDAIFRAYGVSDEAATRLNRLADELLHKERAAHA